MSGRHRAYIGLGANVGPAREMLERSVSSLAALPGAAVEGVSRLYRTRPVGLLEQPDFLNAAVALGLPARDGPEDGAMALLVALKDLERRLGRQERERWGPREIDLDVLIFGPHRLQLERGPEGRSDDPRRAGPQWLEVPHPAARERLFVLAPLADLAPKLVPPGWDVSVEKAAAEARAREGPRALELVGDWDTASQRWVSTSGGSAAGR